MLATATEVLPHASDWISELKLDGYRLMVRKRGNQVSLITRNGHDWTARLSSVAERFQAVRADEFLLDGELVSLRQDGHPSFADLQRSLLSRASMHLYFYHLEGECSIQSRAVAWVEVKAVADASLPLRLLPSWRQVLHSELMHRLRYLATRTK